MTAKLPLGHVVVLVLGLTFLYLPILVLIAYSFNASALVTVWGGFSAVWYARLLCCWARWPRWRLCAYRDFAGDFC
jgi:ABC-type spermidine/putrescine transport system permease subunit II